jgi:hypothetical protein
MYIYIYVRVCVYVCVETTFTLFLPCYTFHLLAHDDPLARDPDFQQ